MGETKEECQMKVQERTDNHSNAWHTDGMTRTNTWANDVWLIKTNARCERENSDVWRVLFTPPVGCSRLPSAVNEPTTTCLLKRWAPPFFTHSHREELGEEYGCCLWYCWKMGSGRYSPDSQWRRFMNVTSVRKSDRRVIGAFGPDLFSVRYQCFWYLSYSS